MDFHNLKILSGNSWDVFLHEDQTVPGRVYFWYTKGEVSELTDIPKEGLSEFYDLAKKIKSALSKSFQPTMLNYLALNNKTKHFHIHLIPRYSQEVRFFDYTFKDTNFGSSYKRNPNFFLPENVILEIKKYIAQNVQ